MSEARLCRTPQESGVMATRKITATMTITIVTQKNRCKTNELCCMCNSLPACLSGTPAFCNSKLWYNLAFPSCSVCLKKALWSYKASVAHAGSAMEVSPVRQAPHTPPLALKSVFRRLNLVRLHGSNYMQYQKSIQPLSPLGSIVWYPC